MASASARGAPAAPAAARPSTHPTNAPAARRMDGLDDQPRRRVRVEANGHEIGDCMEGGRPGRSLQRGQRPARPAARATRDATPMQPWLISPGSTGGGSPRARASRRRAAQRPRLTPHGSHDPRPVTCFAPPSSAFWNQRLRGKPLLRPNWMSESTAGMASLRNAPLQRPRTDWAASGYGQEGRTGKDHPALHQRAGRTMTIEFSRPKSSATRRSARWSGPSARRPPRTCTRRCRSGAPPWLATPRRGPGLPARWSRHASR